MSSTDVLPVVLVHYRSGGMLVDAVGDLFAQQDVALEVHVVECGDDGTVDELARRWPHVVVHRPGANLGYCAGNNHALKRLPPGADVLIVNPDVRLPDPTTVCRLRQTLASEADLGAVAPVIRTHFGAVEYLDSVIDVATANAFHDRTMLPTVPADVPPLVRLPWINGACWLLRGAALEQVGRLDDRYFLFNEEVDWAVRAGATGWALGLLTAAEVSHTRSASFGTSTKGAYYYWRNRWLLFHLHGGHARWRRAWLAQWLRFVAKPDHVRSGASLNALWGGLDAVRGRYGPRPLRA